MTDDGRRPIRRALISVSMVSGEASAVLIRSLFNNMGLPLRRVSSIMPSDPLVGLRLLSA
jgi:hypothetical protein